MGYLNTNQQYAISKFLDRYDYDSVLDILEEAGILDGDLYFLIESSQYAQNFNFKEALKCLEKMSESMLSRREIQKLKTNLKNLELGEPEEILSELVENMKIQVVNQEYIDFLGRLYRLKEALFKYIFVSTKESKTYRVNMYGYMLSKKNILYTLKKKYNIYNGNLIHGVTQYINRHVKKTKRMEKVVEILNSERLESLIKMRNESPVGHGFKGASKEEIEEIYGNPMEVIQDLVKACELLDLGITVNKYDNINEMAIQMIGSYDNH
ncbi:MAG: hypothetical protein ACRC92_09905 [Peptostreptococcaceae bacterium]